MLSRIYFSGELRPGGRCVLPPPQSRHCARVLRLEPGDAVTVFNGDGGEYAAVIAKITGEGVILDIGGRAAVDREAPFPVTLAQGLSSGERMDFTLQKAVELGVAAIQPLATSRSVARLPAERAEKRLAHWRSVVIAACEQCGRNCVPGVQPLADLRDWLGQAAGLHEGAAKLMLSPRAAGGLRELARPAQGVVLLAGPEGGLAPGEERAALAAGFNAVRLGPRVLRTETAAIAALAAMQVLWGDF